MIHVLHFQANFGGLSRGDEFTPEAKRTSGVEQLAPHTSAIRADSEGPC